MDTSQGWKRNIPPGGQGRGHQMKTALEAAQGFVFVEAEMCLQRQTSWQLRKWSAPTGEGGRWWVWEKEVHIGCCPRL